ncbi:MAG: hypothetical protein VX725_00560 [Actinomycetota bacterium]|nr:hypothetical protein [Actinomycetota bacterium]
MAQRRPIDVAVTKFYGAMIVSTVGIFALVAIWVGLTRSANGRQFPYLNTAFVLSWLISVVLIVGILEYARRRPVDGNLTWGEANLWAFYVFLLLFWIYGVVPHQWLTFASNDLSWRADRELIGPTGLGFTNGEGLLQWALPFKLNYLVVGDLIVVVIYGLGLVANVALWSIWQNRGKEAPPEIETSTYGRPILREGAS